MNVIKNVWDRSIGALLVGLCVGMIRLYQITISPLLGPVCRYYPSCSHYGLEAIKTHRTAKGIALTAARILRCNPWSDGGLDPVPPRGSWSNPKVIESSTTLNRQVVSS